MTSRDRCDPGRRPGRSRRPEAAWLGAAVCAVAILASGPAAAYVGPGAGLSMLGALWAVVAAVGIALFGIVLWPVRALIRRRKRASAGSAGQHDQGPGVARPAERPGSKDA
jgi:hypothetical protein